MHVNENAVRAGNLAQQEGAPVSQLRVEMAELVTGIRHGDRLGTLGDVVTGKDSRTIVCVQGGEGWPECLAKCLVENDQARVRDRRGRCPGVKVITEVDVAVVEGYRFQCLYPQIKGC